MIPQIKQVLLASGVIAALAVATSASAQSGGGLERVAVNPEASFTVTGMVGTNEVPVAGDTDGTGSATITVNVSTGLVCVNATTANLDGLVNMHIHQGAAGVAGPVVVDFAVTSGSAVAKCVTTTPTQAQAIVDAPASFYLNAHSTTFPNGAIRAQLAVHGNDAGALRMLSEPVRTYDSRSGAILAANETRTVDLKLTAAGGASGMPIGTRAAIVTLTVTQTVNGGYLTLFSNSIEGIPATSTVNWTASGQDVAATTTVAVDGSGKVKVAAGPSGTHFIVDVIGYYQ
jgi:hypothetical protein